MTALSFLGPVMRLPSDARPARVVAPIVKHFPATEAIYVGGGASNGTRAPSENAAERHSRTSLIIAGVISAEHWLPITA